MQDITHRNAHAVPGPYAQPPRRSTDQDFLAMRLKRLFPMPRDSLSLSVPRFLQVLTDGSDSDSDMVRAFGHGVVLRGALWVGNSRACASIARF